MSKFGFGSSETIHLQHIRSCADRKLKETSPVPFCRWYLKCVSHLLGQILMFFRHPRMIHTSVTLATTFPWITSVMRQRATNKTQVNWDKTLWVGVQSTAFNNQKVCISSSFIISILNHLHCLLTWHVFPGSAEEGAVLCRRRSCLPSPSPNNSSISLWNILRNNIGKDLSKVTMPVQLNEPLNTLQRLCEELEYSELLDRAAKTQDPFERMVRRKIRSFLFECGLRSHVCFRHRRILEVNEECEPQHLEELFRQNGEVSKDCNCKV